MNKRGLLLLLVLLLVNAVFGFVDYADKYSCHSNGGLFCDNFESNKCAMIDDLTDSLNTIDCRISSNYYVDVDNGLGNNILYFNRLIFDSGASIHFVDSGAGEGLIDYGFYCDTGDQICYGEGGNGGDQEDHGGDGGKGGTGGILGFHGGSGAHGQNFDEGGDDGDGCDEGGDAGGGTGNKPSGATIGIIAFQIEISDEVTISVEGVTGGTGDNGCMDTDGYNAGSGGGGGGGGSGAGNLFVVATELVGDQQGINSALNLVAKGGKGGAGGDGEDGPWNNEGGGGGGGGGGEGGKVYFSVETSEVTHSLIVNEGAGGGGGNGYSNAINGGTGEGGPSGEAFGPGEWELSELEGAFGVSIKENYFGSPYFVCNDGIDNDGDGNTDMADEDCYETSANELGWETEAHNLAADWFDASSNTGADGVCGDDAGDASCIGSLYCPSIPNDECGDFEGCSLTGGATSCDSLWNDEFDCLSQEGCSWEWQDSYCSGFLWSDSVCAVFGSDLCGLPVCLWISGHNDCVGTANSCEDNVNQIGCECTGSPSCDSFDNCYDEYGCNYINEGDDFAYVDPNGTYFCNYRDTDDDDSPEWTWENSQVSPSGTTFNINDHKEHIITNSQKWFVCDANSSTSLTYFNGTIYDSMIEEFGTFTDPSGLHFNMKTCLDALHELTEFESFGYCEDLYGDSYDYASCCEKAAFFSVDDPDGFESVCSGFCFDVLGDTLATSSEFGQDLCDFEQFSSLLYCTENEVGLDANSVLLELCGFDLAGCLSQTLDPFISCEEQGFSSFDICSEEKPICSGALIYSIEEGSSDPEQTCCVSNSEEVTCSDSSSIIDEDSCLNNEGTVYDINDGYCSPPAFAITLPSGDSCCFGTYVPSLDLYQTESADKFICYKGNLDTTGNNLIAECCFDDYCLNNQELIFGTDRNFRGPGSDLHEISKFDLFDATTGQFQNYGKRLKTNNAQTGLIISSANLRTTNWEGFNILEFDVGFNSADYFEIYLTDSNGEHSLGKLSNYLVTGSQPYRWQKAMIILPLTDGSVSIDYSSIENIKIMPTHLPGDYLAQIIIDDFSLSRMEVLE